MQIFEPLSLPNGTTVPNRIAKAAMEENMADAEMGPSQPLMQLYQAWADGGAGLLISGNVMIDPRAMTGPGGVVLEDERQLDKFKRWAEIGRSKGAQFWMQINHPGRQMQNNLGQETWAPSAVPIDLGNLSKRFDAPKAMSEEKIQDVIQRFIRTAQLAEKSGFTGVQIHAAHGYLLSQFLSPLTNRREDQWGGSLENRARLLLEVVKGVRAVVSAEFSVSVKINSADFQRGGFSPDEARQVVQLLNALSVDMVEISGGSYEAPAMHGRTRDDSTIAREAYFLEFAKEIQATANMPIMVTGGIRRAPIAEQAIESGIDMVGIATALAINPRLPNDWRKGEDSAPMIEVADWKNKTLASLAYMATVKYQLTKLSKNNQPNPSVSPLWALLSGQVKIALQSRRYRRLMAG
ncbi:2,4-dienoyl-CoA reductase-like NADH-dependent reductase (Old Yellow Enzyme family) [Litorivivens lipolytica]|uniref:2,4-dienoyl-CoA reductase-like NADH-dependent reductase (Old Yellow Enzyme family) n=1 Tax=Litorivivens lipolytica TaxID=1524264 RepID=A0A7W4W689_9GAMM|nr:NADH:flavin oxidoreductase/NADH oxidase family protein [Litorivivens lipolytica]MBB3048205.1 2,4-dienoyl-CoA reductase-like NADH-dependent reductase (Old Yellow Enzyme family) [Litorivivens lipolytica]